MQVDQLRSTSYELLFTSSLETGALMNMIGITAYYPAENATVPTRTECIKLQTPDSKLKQFMS